MPAENDEYGNEQSSDLEESMPGSGNETDHSDKINVLLADDVKTKQLAQDVIVELKTFEPLIDVDDQFINGLVILIKASKPRSAGDVTEAIYPAIKEL